jgi:hypothetical protein
MFKKTGLEAAKHYFADNLTDAYRKRDPHGWNLSHGLYFVAEALQDMERRIYALETALNPPDPNQQRRR